MKGIVGLTRASSAQAPGPVRQGAHGIVVPKILVRPHRRPSPVSTGERSRRALG